jgi:hypothetical protein
LSIDGTSKCAKIKTSIPRAALLRKLTFAPAAGMKMLSIRVTKGNPLLLLFFVAIGGEKAMSEKYISPAEREYIAKAWGNYASVAEIATHLGKSRKTIYAELRRGQDGEKLDRNQRPVYDPELAQRRFQANLRRRGKPQQAGT